MLLISASTVFVVAVLWASWLRLEGAALAGPATIAAIVFPAHANWPLALVTLVVYLFVRKNERTVVEA